MNFSSTPPDLNSLPYQYLNDVQLFLYNNSTTWANWYKPPGATMVHIVCIGGGAGGGGATIGAAGNNKSGGGGGACNGLASITLPAFFLPDVLYVQVGASGAGGAGTNGGTGVTGGTGGTSYVSLGHSTAVPNVIISSNGATAPAGGTGGQPGAAGTGGTAPTIATSSIFSNLGFFSAVIGLAGSNGGLRDAAGAGVTNSWSTLQLTPGAGGAGSINTNQLGGSITLGGAADFNFVNFGTAIAAGGPVSTAGNSGVMLWQPFFQLGGTGGGSSNTVAGGRGGTGGYGCGGGGGASGIATGDSGKGGDGGNGLVLFISY